ncbi:MAG: hypothetical protein BM563_12150 [Bacteroidetes bacterium MedPE-SWsnd-G1]|nr:MAG: hypothetical protein BM563_12150 [Bacteroidetes bacterium MedPE-SWsnd-G1]
MISNQQDASSSNKIVTIFDSPFLHEVQIARERLKIEGIESFIPDEHLTTIGFVTDYRLQIRSFDAIKAKSILKSITE